MGQWYICAQEFTNFVFQRYYAKTRVQETADVVSTVNTLGAKNAREAWEDIFNRTYIQPVLEVHMHNKSNFRELNTADLFHIECGQNY